MFLFMPRILAPQQQATCNHEIRAVMDAGLCTIHPTNIYNEHSPAACCLLHNVLELCMNCSANLGCDWYAFVQCKRHRNFWHVCTVLPTHNYSCQSHFNYGAPQGHELWIPKDILQAFKNSLWHWFPCEVDNKLNKPISNSQPSLPGLYTIYCLQNLQEAVWAC